MRRALAVAALACAVVGLWATPAFAHAVLDGSDPAAGAIVTDAPRAVTLSFSESVEASLGGIKVFDARGRRLDLDAPGHPGGDAGKVRASLPDLADGSYVVTWRVTSSDSHPVRGAFTFTVGTSTASNRRAASLAQRLLTDEGGSSVVGALFALARFAVFVGLAVLIGASAFLAFVWPAGRGVARAARVVWIAWAVALGLTLVGFALQGSYAGGLPLGDALKPSLWSDVGNTRFGHVWLARTGMLLLAIPLLRRLLPQRGPVSEHPLPQWWLPAWALLVLGLAATPGLAGHAAAGPLVPLALVTDTLHVGAVGLWLGGLVVLLVALLPVADERTLREMIPRYSAYALAAVGVIVATGVFQTFRQVNRIGSLLDTDYGRLLLIKILVFLGLMVVAAFSRDVVNRRWRVPSEVVHAPAAVDTGADPGRLARADQEHEHDAEYPEGFVLDEPTAERRLRRALVVEVVISAVILAVTALLVNAAPARDQGASGPFIATLKTKKLLIDTVLTPARRGTNELHLTVLTPRGGPADVVDVTAALSQPAKGIAPIKFPLLRAGPGHYISNGFTVPFAGDWRLTVRALVTQVDEVTASATVPIH